MTDRLPTHPHPGVSIEAGDRIVLTGLSLSFEDWVGHELPLERAVVARVPDWADEYPVGYSFALTQRVTERTHVVDGHRVEITNGGWGITVGLAATAPATVETAFVLANRVLDVLATDHFAISGLYEPLFEYASWRTAAGARVLTRSTWTHLRFRAGGALQVIRPDGAAHPSPARQERKWHPSHAFFRRSQLTEDVHEAYRYLFLAFEALLSDPLPQRAGEGERKWFRRVISRVATEYSLELSHFIHTTSADPLSAFVDEQYEAMRCALFHAKLGRQPILPDDLHSRAAVVRAMDGFGRLYIEVSRQVTGAIFASGGAGQSVLQECVKTFAAYPGYLSATAAFNPLEAIRSESRADVVTVAGQTYPAVRTIWAAEGLPERLVRFGAVGGSEDKPAEAWGGSGVIETTRADRVELLLVCDVTNIARLRQSYS